MLKVMSPNASKPNEILSDDNYYLWEFNVWMALTIKGMQEDLEAMKPEDAARRETEEWKAADMKALAIVAQILNSTYQSMIRERGLPQKYDAMIPYYRGAGEGDVAGRKEMLLRELEFAKKKEENEQAFKSLMHEQGDRGGRERGNRGRRGGRGGREGYNGGRGQH
ncbi:uncharacterized protein PHALS_07544 [Plasmopara halstedii]|uniref:Uncharacterized protein n=1 Tax=Plasmopara halstedii TaxID=4781 RepID=A0A0P1B7I0_PLAHL|nr:uncharacterized protein PHALS_07544 [Plasmopara halstedii]CEG49800.1 hypothetical protein PHALS_07544 [Plasmopara halstedii]|eukprot:XP_024586169.1 hypothetical protein PHALS_07544 [Plasmopara halstedii]